MMRYTKTFAKSLTRLVRSEHKQKVLKEIKQVVTQLTKGKKLHETYLDYALKGDFIGYRECHIQGDLLLLYTIEENELVLRVVNVGSHKQIFFLVS